MYEYELFKHKTKVGTLRLASPVLPAKGVVIAIPGKIKRLEGVTIPVRFVTSTIDHRNIHTRVVLDVTRKSKRQISLLLKHYGVDRE